MKKKLLLILSLMVITSAVQADFFDKLINKIANKIEKKTDEVVESKTDDILNGDILDDEPEVIEVKPVQVISRNDKNNNIEKLRELIEMKKNGYITDSEFQKQKALILN